MRLSLTDTWRLKEARQKKSTSCNIPFICSSKANASLGIKVRTVIASGRERTVWEGVRGLFLRGDGDTLIWVLAYRWTKIH